MKTRNHQQNVLKALLLLAVVANVAASLSGNPRLNSTNLSSETRGGGTAPAPVADSSSSVPLPPTTTAKVLDQTNVQASIVPVNVDAPAPVTTLAAPVVIDQAPVDPAPPVNTSSLTRSELPKICGQRFYITYREITLADGTLTEINVQPHTGEISGFKPITYRVNGGVAVNFDQADVKEDNDNKIASLIRSHLGRCQEDPVASSTSSDNRAIEKSDRETIKAGMKACRLNSRGDALSEVQQTRCHLDELNNLTPDSDSLVDRDRLTAKVEKIVKDDLQKAIKNRLMSRDDSKVDEGEELLEQTIDAVNDLTTENSLDSYRMTRLISSLKAFKAGGQAFRQASDLQDRVKDNVSDMKEQITEATTNAQQNPRDPIAQQRLSQVKYDVFNREKLLESEAQTDMSHAPYTELLADSQLGYLQTSDFTQFVQPFQILNNDLASMRGMIMGQSVNGISSIGATGMIAPTMPADFLTYRQGLSQQFQSNFGTTVPQTPVLPALGLNPSANLYNGLQSTSLTTSLAPNTTFISSPQIARQLR